MYQKTNTELVKTETNTNQIQLYYYDYYCDQIGTFKYQACQIIVSEIFKSSKGFCWCWAYIS